MKGALTFSKARATLKMMFRPWEKNEKKEINVQLKKNIELNSLLTYSQLNNHMKELRSKTTTTTTTCLIPRQLSQTLNLNDKNYQTYFFRIQCKCQ